MDQLTIVREFASLAPVMADRELCRRVRLLAAFGFNGSEVLFVTAEDNAYCFGPNRFGCLGLGIDADTPVDAPRLNRHLSGVQLANLYYGFGHCIGLTACGQLYAWGENTYGQLGIGSFETTPTPVVITAFTKKRVVDITCGNRHTLALTSDGLVYGWGRNTFGQIGDGTWCWRQWPTPVSIDEPISAISCGKCHSLALSTAGRLYVWGLNDFGQLGRHRDNDMKHFADGRVKERAFGECPEPVDGFEDTVVRKACCGPNHTLMLTAEGDIYAFGFNDFGQIGNGCHDNQYTPLKVEAETKFKDIVAHYDNNLSIGVSVDDKYWVWGFNYKKKKISKPYNVSKWTASYTLVDVFARYSGISKTYKTITFDELTDDTYDEECSAHSVAHCVRAQEVTDDALVENVEQILRKKLSLNGHSVQSDNSCSLPLKLAAKCDTNTPIVVFNKSLIKAFDNQLNYDLVLVFDGKTIFCHKEILRLRNRFFWRSIEEYVNYNPMAGSDELHIGDEYSYDAMYSFIQLFYSIRPRIDGQNADQLLRMATDYGETELKSMCSQYMQSIVDPNNVCHIYETAVSHGLDRLVNRCLEFAANNWQIVSKTIGFLAMNEKLSEQLVRSALNTLNH